MRRIAPTLLLVFTTFIVLARVLWGDFVLLDDHFTLKENPYFNPPTWETLAYYWTSAEYGLYYPLTNTLWAGIAWISSTADAGSILLSPFPFHLVNLLVHTASVLLVHRILRLLFRDERAAILGAMMFALHPLQVEPIAWISGLKDLLAGFFALAALMQYIHFADPRQSHAAKTRYLLLFSGFLCLQMGMLSKASVMTLPLIAGVIDVLLLRRSVSAAMWSAGLWLVGCVPLLVVAQLAQQADPAVASELSLRPLVAMDSLSFYLQKLVIPLNLTVDYGRTAQSVVQSGAIWWRWIIPVAVLIGAAALVRKHREPLAAVLVFVLAPLPTLGLTPLLFAESSSVADRYLYLAMLGPAIFIAWLVARFGSSLIRMGVMFALLLLTYCTIAQTKVWQNDFTLFTHAIEVNPRSGLAACNLGAAYHRVGEHALAKDAYELALKHHPDAIPAILGKGLAMIAAGDIPGGLEQCDRAIQLQIALPKSQRGSLAPPLMGIAQELLKQNRREEGFAWFRLAIQSMTDPGQRDAAIEQMRQMQLANPATAPE